MHKSFKVKSVSFLFILFLSTSLMSWTIYNYDQTPNDDFIYDVVEQMPEFPGGKQGLNKYIADNLIYPKRVKKAGVKGTVYTECVIEKNGEVTNQKVFKGFSHKLENEALKVINNMPNWIPGKQKGKLVRVKVTMPIEFK